MISRHVIYCDHYPDGAGEAGSNARERNPATVSHEIIYCRKGNLSESPNHLKFWENILISILYEQFSRRSRNLGPDLGHFWKLEKISDS